MKLSILIKTLDEERNIERCLASVQHACSGLKLQDVEIIVADSLSSDRTPQIAASQGATVVQLASTRDRGCGAGVQLGYQHSRGEYVMLLDGDMELDAHFLPAAIARLDADPTLAGVAGQLEDTAVRNWFDRRRSRVKATETGPQLKWLSGGGMFRRRAIDESGGYAGNRNLMAFEEAELGMRLNSQGWRLERLPCVGVRHTGHAVTSIGLIRKYWSSGRMDAAGVLLRQACGESWFWSACQLFAHPIGVIAFWVIIVTALAAFPLLEVIVSALLVVTAVFAVLALRKWSIRDAGLSLALWHVGAVGLVRGLFRRVISPSQHIQSRVWRNG